MDRIKRSGFYAYVVPEAYGGKGVSSVNLCILREELAKISTFADEAFIMQGLGSNPILRFGNERQKAKYCLPWWMGRRWPTSVLPSKVQGLT